MISRNYYNHHHRWNHIAVNVCGFRGRHAHLVQQNSLSFLLADEKSFKTTHVLKNLQVSLMY